MTNIPAGIRSFSSRPSVRRRTALAADKLITIVQEWLEGPDTELEKLVANLVVGGAAVYLVAAVAEIMGR